MKKLVSLVLMIAIIMSVSTTVLADNSIFGNGNNNENNGNVEIITPGDYDDAQKEKEEEKKEDNKAQENNDSKLPQTGVEDTGLGILLIVCLGSVVFAYKKINSYRDI